MMNVYKAIKINKTTKEETIIIDNEYIQIVQMIIRDIDKTVYDVKVINNRTNKEINIDEIKTRTNYDRDYKTNIRIYRNNYIKMY